MVAGHPVRIIVLLMNVMKSVDYAIHVKCIEDMKFKLKAVIPVFFVTLILEVSSVPVVTMINMINRRTLVTGKNPKMISIYF